MAIHPEYSSVVFAGGGCRCVWQVGFWETAAPELRLKPKTIGAVSAGSAMATMLIEEGYHVLQAGDGKEAYDMALKQPIDVVLSDLRMPRMDGMALLAHMQMLAPETPVIMATAFAVEELIRDALREGAFGALYKPVDFDRLFELIEQAISGGLMVLVVDDDEQLCANLADLIAERGYRVDVANDGDRAVELAREESLDILLIDLKLPPLNGLETYLAIRDFRPTMVAIIITGHLAEMRQLARQAAENSAYACLEKPLDIDQLMAIIERIERQKQDGTINKLE